jgi:hypothetical protein
VPRCEALSLLQKPPPKEGVQQNFLLSQTEFCDLPACLRILRSRFYWSGAHNIHPILHRPSRFRLTFTSRRILAPQGSRGASTHACFVFSGQGCASKRCTSAKYHNRGYRVLLEAALSISPGECAAGSTRTTREQITRPRGHHRAPTRRTGAVTRSTSIADHFRLYRPRNGHRARL